MPIYTYEGTSILFRHIPKTGGEALRATLLSIPGVQDAFRALSPVEHWGFPVTPQHFHDVILRELLPANAFVADFTVTRHPVERMKSEYRMRVNESSHTLPEFNEWLEEQFARVDMNPHHDDNHFRPQVEFISDRTTVFAYEDGLEFPLALCLDAWGLQEIQCPIMRTNVGATVATNVSDESLMSIKQRYAVDFERFAYSL